MVALLLAAWLSTQQWEWGAVTADPTVTAYRIYWSSDGRTWCSVNRVEFDAATHCGLLNHCNSDTTCCGEILEPSNSAFIAITAVNSAGESSTEHGEVTTCP
jgi:hypothetical protein